MDDLISRQSVINIFLYFNANQRLEMIKKLPSAQPERKKGEWLRMYYNRPKQYTRICSECREISWFCGIGDYNYCPWCGARMEREENE